MSGQTRANIGSNSVARQSNARVEQRSTSVCEVRPRLVSVGSSPPRSDERGDGPEIRTGGRHRSWPESASRRCIDEVGARSGQQWTELGRVEARVDQHLGLRYTVLGLGSAEAGPGAAKFRMTSIQSGLGSADIGLGSAEYPPSARSDVHAPRRDPSKSLILDAIISVHIFAPPPSIPLRCFKSPAGSATSCSNAYDG